MNLLPSELLQITNIFLARQKEKAITAYQEELQQYIEIFHSGAKIAAEQGQDHYHMTYDHKNPKWRDELQKDLTVYCTRQGFKVGIPGNHQAKPSSIRVSWAGENKV